MIATLSKKDTPAQAVFFSFEFSKNLIDHLRETVNIMAIYLIRIKMSDYFFKISIKRDW